jgi:hypothetical protein
MGGDPNVLLAYSKDGLKSKDRNRRKKTKPEDMGQK